MADTSEASIAAAQAYLSMIVAESEEIKTLAIVLLAFVCLSVAVRMYVRIHMLRQFGLEDWFMIAAFIFSASQCSIAIAVVTYGVRAAYGDQHANNINTNLSKVSTGMFALALVALKISLGFFFLKIFSHKKRQRWAIITLCVLSTITGLAYFAFATFTCTTLKQAPGTEASCAIQPVSNGVFYAFSVVSIASDYVFTLMAVAALWSAKLPVTTKLPACGLLVLGTIGGVASTIRFVLLVEPTTLTGYVVQLFAVGKWTVVEHSVGLIAANLAMTRPLLHACVLRVKGVSTLGTGTKTTRMATNGSNFRLGGGSTGNGVGGLQRSQRGHTLQSDARQTEERDGETYLLHDIKREVTVVVDEEKASADSDFGHSYHNAAFSGMRYPEQARTRRF